MKVKIGNYPSRLRSKIFEDYMHHKYGYIDWPAESQYTRLERALEWLDDRLQSVYNIFNWLWFDRRKQKIDVRIDPWDTWCMDHTLAHIVVPMLKQLKEFKGGAPNVDKEDVPEELWPNEAEEEAYSKNGEVDIHFWARWDWVLDEMIFAFEAKRMDNWEEQFYSGDIDIYFEDLDSGHSKMVRGPNDTFTVDQEGLKAYAARMNNGFRLFGKYYLSLWD